jgi:outer membrane protein assembly complex protein YaeT
MIPACRLIDGDSMLRVSLVRVIAATALAAACMSAGAEAAQTAQPRKDIKVSSLAFEGNTTFPDEILRTVIQTRQASRWPWAHWVPFDQRRLDADLSRLRAFYADQGFPDSRVRLGEVKVSADGNSISIHIVIEEGAPLVVGEVRLEGLEGLPEVIARPAAELPFKAGDRRDNAQLLGVRNRIVGLLREHGRPFGKVEIEEIGAAAGVVDLVIRVTAGPETHFGALTIMGLAETKQVVVHRAVTFNPGDLYRESEVNRSQRRLATLQAFDFVNLVPEAAAREAITPVLPMTITVTEAKRHRYEVGVGYGTEDRARGSFEWRNLNFLGNASQLIANAKYSTVLRGAGFGYEHPYLLPSGGTLSARAGAWWTKEAIFDSRTAGGQFTITHEFGRVRRAGVSLVSGWEAGVSYRNEYLAYQVTPAALADLGTVEERIALGLDPVTGRGSGTIAGVSMDLSHRSLDNPTDPSKGTTFALHVKHIAPWMRGTFRFDELVGEVRGYLPIYGRLRIAAKLRGGALRAPGDTRIPFSERYFLGGSSSVRGWGRYQISPVSDRGVPIGGRSLFEGNVELRFPLVGYFGGVAFLDAGQVGPEPWTITKEDIRYAVGTGIRYTSLIGVVRGDIGWQLNPIAELRVNGAPQRRAWRIHLSIGHAF